MRFPFAFLLGSLALLTGCESGTITTLDVTVTDALARSGSTKAPLVLASDDGRGPKNTRLLAPLCGATFGRRVFSIDVPFSCAGRGSEENVDVHAWVATLPDGVDAARFCALVPGDDGIDSGRIRELTKDGGVVTLPSLSEAIGSGTARATWERDMSPCGGTLDATLLVE